MEAEEDEFGCSDSIRDLMAEIQLDDAFGGDDREPAPSVSSSSFVSKRAKAAVDLVDSKVVVKQPLAGTISRRGNSIYCGEVKTGTVSYLAHWTPAAIAGNCIVHGAGVCYCTMPLLGADEDGLVRWLGEASCYASAADHMSCVPTEAYHSRRTRVRGQ